VTAEGCRCLRLLFQSAEFHGVSPLLVVWGENGYSARVFHLAE